MKKVKTTKKKVKKESKSKWHIDPIFVMAGLAVITFINFFPTFQNDFVNWDDPSYILNNTRIQNFSLWELIRMFNPFPSAYLVSNYHPLTELSLAIDHMFFGLKPWGFHFTNILIHIFNTILVYLLTTRFLKGYQVAGIITALFFAIHPMHLESVVWASERKDVLHVFFYLLAMLQYLRYLESGRVRKYLLYTLILFVCSLLSKAQAVTLPIVLMLMDYYYNRKDLQAIAIEKAPFLILSLLFGLLAIYAQKSTQADALVTISIMDRPFTGSMALLIYLFKVIVPTGLCALHPYPFKIGESMPTYFYPAILGMLAYLGAIFVAFKKDWKEVFFGLSFFLITILPVLQFLTIGEALWAERYSYLPYIGLFLVIGYLVDRLENNVKWGKFHKPALGILFVGALACIALSWNRIPYWENSPTLWEDVLDKYPGEKLAYVNLSHFYSEVKEWDKSQQYAEEGIKHAPDHYKLYVNKAFSMMKKKQHQQAIPVLQEAAKRDGEHYEIYFNLGICYDNLKQYDKAMKAYNKTLEYEANHIQAFLQRGVIYSNHKNDQQMAIKDFQRVVDYAPTHLDALMNLAVAQYKVNKNDAAIATISKALEVDPKRGKAWYIRALAYSKKGQYKLALEDGRRAKANGQTGLEATLQQWQQAIK